MTALYTPLSGDVPTAAELATLVPVCKYKPVDEPITSSTAMHTDAALFTTVVSGATYQVALHLLVDGPSAGGFRFWYTAPSGSTLDWASGAVDGGTILAATYNAEKRTITDFSGGSITFGAGTIQVIRSSGLLTVGPTGGTFAVQWAQGTSNATATTVRAGSHLILHQVA